MFRILHISDLHAREEARWSTDALLIAAKTVLLAEANKHTVDVLAFTGDIAYSGKQNEYEIASAWIEEFCLSPSGLNLDQNRLLFVPGNHDVDRARTKPIADAVIERLSKSTSQDDVAKHLSDKQSLDASCLSGIMPTCNFASVSGAVFICLSRRGHNRSTSPETR